VSLDRSTALKAVERLDRAGALQTLVRGALPTGELQTLLSDALPAEAARELPDEVWAGLATGIAASDESFAHVLAERLHDHLTWDAPPGPLETWWPLVVDRPLEALWMAALADAREIREEFDHIARHCVENFRNSPEDTPPSWEFIEGVLAVQARTARTLADTERRAADAERRVEAARQRQDELRAQLKKLRRENAGLRSALARAERRADGSPEDSPDEPAERVERLERRLRKLEKERTHLARKLERQRGAHGSELPPGDPEPAPPAPVADTPAEPAPDAPSVRDDPEPRRRVLRFMLRKLLQKSKIGAAHTHQDNLYRGLPDHQKGLAKQVIELLYREGFLVPKPTASDPHVSLAPERLVEAREIVGGRVANPRLAGFVEQGREERVAP
jgi:chaperonin cofactor prefoldin